MKRWFFKLIWWRWMKHCRIVKVHDWRSCDYRTADNVLHHGTFVFDWEGKDDAA